MSELEEGVLSRQRTGAHHMCSFGKETQKRTDGVNVNAWYGHEGSADRLLRLDIATRPKAAPDSPE